MTPDTKGILWLLLDDVSQARLRATFPALYDDTYYHHITLQYDVPLQSVVSYVGQEHQVVVYAVAHNDYAQAVRVRTAKLPDTYGVPHITLSTKAGIAPYESVSMLQNKHQETVVSPALELHGTVAFQPLRP